MAAFSSTVDLSRVPVRIEDDGWTWVFYPQHESIPATPVRMIGLANGVSSAVALGAATGQVLLDELAELGAWIGGGFGGPLPTPIEVEQILQAQLRSVGDSMVGIYTAPCLRVINATFGPNGTEPDPAKQAAHFADLEHFSANFRAVFADPAFRAALNDPAKWGESLVLFAVHGAEDIGDAVGNTLETAATVVWPKLVWPIVSGAVIGPADALGIDGMYLASGLVAAAFYLGEAAVTNAFM